MPAVPLRKTLSASALCLAVTIAGVVAVALPASPAHAIVVFDPSNYSQNVLAAARALEQINNQIRALQNQAQSLANQARNLATIDFPEVEAITSRLRQIDQLMAEAQGIQFRVGDLDRQFGAMFPDAFSQALGTDQQVIAARKRLDTEKAAYRQTMSVQAGVIENVEADARVLNAIVARSQNAQGTLQAQQATNQLLALTTKQQFQLQTLIAAQYRARAVEQARQLQAEAAARVATTRFLGSGSAYSQSPSGH